MNGAARQWLSAVQRSAASKLSMASAVDLAVMLTASASMALLVALAGSYLPDPPTASELLDEALPTPQPNVLLFCWDVAEGRRCIQEAT